MIHCILLQLVGHTAQLVPGLLVPLLLRVVYIRRVSILKCLCQKSSTKHLVVWLDVNS